MYYIGWLSYVEQVFHSWDKSHLWHINLFYVAGFELPLFCWFFFCLYSSLVLVAQSCLTLCNLMDSMQPARLLCPWNSPGKNTRVGGHFLLQGIFLTQGSIPALQADSSPSEPPEKPIRVHVGTHFSWYVFVQFCYQENNVFTERV